MLIGGSDSVIGVGDSVASKANMAVQHNPKVNRSFALPVDTTGAYRNAKFIGATIPCVVPTSYAGNDQALHPSVVYIPTGWNGYKYWMAMTPFPENEAAPANYENPEIVASNDGQTWVVPSGLTNPIDTPSSGYLHNDTQLWFENGTLYCFYGHLKNDVSLCDICYQASRDGITWSGRQYLIKDSTAKNEACPIIEKVGDTYYLWTASYPNGTPGSGTLYLRTSKSLLSGYSAPVQCTFTGLNTDPLIPPFYGTACTWTAATKTLTKSGLFTNYTFASGDRMRISSATAGTNGIYTIASKTNNNTIVLDSLVSGSGVATDQTDVICGPTIRYWHGDIKFVNDRFVMIAQFFTNDYGNVILHGTSHDGLAWTMEYHLGTNADYGTYAGTTGAFDAVISWLAKMYRPCFIPYADGKHFDVWYSINHTTDSEIGKGEMFITPHPEYSLDKLDALLTLMGDVRGFWPFLERSGTVIQDYSVKAHHFTPTGTNGISSWATAPTFRSPIHILTFDGTNDWMTQADHNDFSFGNGSTDSAMSVGAWVYVTNTAADKIIMSKFNSDSAKKEWRFWLGSDEKLYLGFNDESAGATAYQWALTSSALSVNAWHFVVATYSGSGGSSGVKLYVDGAQVSGTTSNGAGSYTAMENLAEQLALGMCTAGGGVYGKWPSAMAMPFLSGTEISAVNIAAMYRIGQGLMQTVAR